ncbi:MAG: hypothetical protein NWE84_00665 [Candidatus Bathyarchaeota archaeon]|nr:hypothetical protein [Candidatus Bathyarchaeota archaeon]
MPKYEHDTYKRMLLCLFFSYFKENSGHKSVNSVMMKTQLIDFKDDDYTTTSHTPKMKYED